MANVNTALRATFSGLVKIEDTFTAAIARANGRRASAVEGLMAQALTSMQEAKLPKDAKGRKQFLAAWKEEWARNAQLQHLVEGGVIRKSTWLGYRTGLFLAYCAGKDWHPNAHQTPDKGGIARPDWWDESGAKGNGKGQQAKGKPDAKPKAKPEPAKPLSKEAELKALRKDCDAIAGRIATLLGNDGAKVLQALKDAGLI